MDRVFLDANVLFSAAYRQETRLLDLWDLEGAELVTSEYALEEARRNCVDPAHRERLERLVEQIDVHADPPLDSQGDSPPDLPENDRPILQAAVAGGASHLLTGDHRAFGRHYGTRIQGVLVVPPARYLSERRS